MAEHDPRHERHVDELVAGCVDCDALAPDLAAIGSALASLRGGRDTGHRDFRILTADAARLRRPGLRNRLRALTAPRFALARPLGSAVTVIALVGLVATSLPGLASLGMARGDSAELAGTRNAAAGPTASPAAPQASMGTAFGAADSPKDVATTEPLTTDEERASEPAPAGPAPSVSHDGQREGTAGVIRLASIVLLLAGALLLIGSTIVRRTSRAREP